VAQPVCSRHLKKTKASRRHMKTWFSIKRLCFTLWIIAAAVVLFFNVRLYTSTPLVDDANRVPAALLGQLNSNRIALNSEAASQMQQLFPEGHYFSYLFHGLTWIELAMRNPKYSAEAIEQAEWCLTHLESKQGRAPFPKSLPPNHGMFYSAWKCHLRAGIATVGEAKDIAQMQRLREECDALSDAMKQSTTPFLLSYTASAWPCDSVPGIHALSTYDRLTGKSRYQQVITQWLSAATRRFDPETGLLPHTANGRTGTDVSVARATSQVIMLRLLPDIVANLAKNQYGLFRDRFFTTFVGAPCVLEYPSGISGAGDIDSGPLIFGLSLSATVLLMGVAQIYGDINFANAIGQAGETVGLPWTSADQKSYFAGILPIGDIMVAYAHVARPWFSTEQHHPEYPYPIATNWRWKTHCLSLLILLPLAWPLSRRWLQNSVKSEQAKSILMKPFLR